MNEQEYKRLQPLRIPTGWTMLFNKSEDIEPEELQEQDKRWLFLFIEDILHMYANLHRKKNKKLEEQKLGIDLGWYPDGEPTGSFRLVAVLDSNWDFPLLEFSSRRKVEIVKTIEKWLFQEFMPLYFIEEDIFRKNHCKYRTY